MRKGLFIFGMICLVSACQNKQNIPTDTTSSGTIHVSAEQIFKPVLDEQIKVFKSSYPDANILIEYKSEIECLKDFQSDSTRMIFITRGLTKQEEAAYKNQLSFTPTFGILAYDAVAILINKNAPDSLYSLTELRKF